MSINKEEANLILEEFHAEYLGKLSRFIRSVSINTLDDMKNKFHEQFTLKDHESLDDFCIRVFLTKDITGIIALPKEYQGLRIVYKKTGRFESLY